MPFYVCQNTGTRRHASGCSHLSYRVPEKDQAPSSQNPPTQIEPYTPYAQPPGTTVPCRDYQNADIHEHTPRTTRLRSAARDKSKNRSPARYCREQKKKDGQFFFSSNSSRFPKREYFLGRRRPGRDVKPEMDTSAILSNMAAARFRPDVTTKVA